MTLVLDQIENIIDLPRQVQAFKDSVTPDLYVVERFVDWNALENELRKYSTAIGRLQHIADLGYELPDLLAHALREDALVYSVLAILMSIPHGAGFVDGREVPEPDGKESLDPDTTANVFYDMGITKLLHPRNDVSNLTRVALITRDAARRRYRIESTFDQRVNNVIEKAVAAHSNLSLLPRSLWPMPAIGRVSQIVALGNRPVIAIASVFQTATGGRQSRDLTVNFPTLREQLAEFGVRLAVIVDGRGIREVASRVLETLFERIDACMTLRQAEEGDMLRYVEQATKNLLPISNKPMEVIIDRLLRDRLSVSINDLPVETRAAQQALAAYKSKRPELDLELTSDLQSLQWRKDKDVQVAHELTRAFSPERAIVSLASVLSLKVNEMMHVNNLTGVCLSGALNDPGLPERFFVGAIDGVPTSDDISRVACLALQETPEARLALLICRSMPTSGELDNFRTLQALLTANVVILDPGFILTSSTSTGSPREQLAQRILEQADLVKASPFVLNSTTPARMFYGREAEEAFLASTLSSNSVALLGGRRIGKTSLMRHVSRRLEDAGYKTFFGDCQIVRDWDGFARMARRSWNVASSSPFVPDNLYQIIDALRDGSSAPLVILLDEIDQLLAWDKEHSASEVPEAFFRACRSISQEGRAQFVFSGERIIATRIRDAASPHWNFCQPLMLRQLTQEAASDLLVKPLQALGVAVDDIEAFSDIAWTKSGGHPQIIQSVGDRIMNLLNNRLPTERRMVSAEDLATITDSYTFAQHYLETYWGQATPLEKVISLIVSDRVYSIDALKSALRFVGANPSDQKLKHALYMLEIYGFLDNTPDGYCPILEWMPSAVSYYGGSSNIIAATLENTSE